MRSAAVCMRSKSLLLPIALVTALLTLGACGKSPADRIAEAAASAASGHKVTIDRDGDNVSIKAADGENVMDISAGDGIKLPKDFPDDVYLPPKYKVVSSMKLGPAMVLGLEAPGSINAMFDQADEQMLAKGWEQTMAMQDGSDSRMSAYKKPDRTATISLHKEKQGVVTVGLQVAKLNKQ